LAKALYSFINTFLDISAVGVNRCTGLGKVAFEQVEREVELRDVKGLVKHKLDVKDEEWID
jgi:hypothetical protein